MPRLPRLVVPHVPHQVTQRNPVRAGLVERPEDWPWSSARAHLCDEPDATLAPTPLVPSAASWRAFLAEAAADTDDRLRRATRTGRPLGDDAFLDRLERLLGRPLRPKTRGPKTGSHWTWTRREPY